MELLVPETGLIIWTIVAILHLILFLVALFSLLKDGYPAGTTRWRWFIVILILPVLGPVAYILASRNKS